MSKHAIGENAGPTVIRFAKVASVFAILLVAATVGPAGIDSGAFGFKSALAGNDNDNGDRNGGRKDGATRQIEKANGLDDSAADPAEAIGAEGGGDPLPGDQLPIGADAVPVNIQVIEEIAGLPEESSLSEEEELEAIRSGWDTWRTADGPNIRTIQ